MAKDGTCRGGARVGAGAKKKPLADKIASGNPSGRPLTVMEFTDAPKLEGVEMPEPNKMLSAEQKDGKTLAANEIYRNGRGLMPVAAQRWCLRSFWSGTR